MNAHRIIPLIVVTALATALIGSPTLAQDAAVGKTPIHRDAHPAAISADLQPTSSGGTTLTVLGLLLAVAIVARRLAQQRILRRTTAAPQSIRLLGRQQLDAELTVRVVQVGPRVLVVACSPQGLATLAELNDPEEIALLTSENATTGELFNGRTSLDRAAIDSSLRPVRRRTSRLAPPTPAGG